MKRNNTPEKLQMTVIEKGLLSLPAQTLLSLFIAILAIAKEHLNIAEIAMAVLGEPNTWIPSMSKLTEINKYRTKTVITERQFISMSIFSALPVNYSLTETTKVYCKTKEDADYIMGLSYLPSQGIDYQNKKSEEYSFLATRTSYRELSCTIEDWEFWESAQKNTNPESIW